MSRMYYAVRYRLEHKEGYFLWHTETGEEDDPDGVVCVAGTISVFRTRQELLAYAQSQSLPLADESDPAFLDLDVVCKWLRRKRPAQLDCQHFLSVWNMFADISASLNGEFDPDKNRTRKIYSKLFWGSNLPAVTPVGCHYEPIWPARESRIMRLVLNDGLRLFRGHIQALK